MLRFAALALLILSAACASKRVAEEQPLDPSITPLTVEQERETR